MWLGGFNMKKIEKRRQTLLLLLIIANIAFSGFFIVKANENRSDLLSGVLTVEGDRKGPEISPLLYGAFFEDINCAADGGLYAELVRNRSFEFLRSYTGWQRIYDRDKAEIVVENSKPINENNPHYIKLSTDCPGGELGLKTAGYGGIAVENNKGYRFSAYIRCEDDFDGFISVFIENEEGKSCGEVEITGLTGEWQKYSAIIKAEESAKEAVLAVMVQGVGTVYMDMISLFPLDTWKGRENGLRKDLVEMLAALEPTFIRFPGGCIVEGNLLVSAYRWKDTIGDPAERKTNPNLWIDFQSYGLGFYEYFLLCEDLGAEPVPILNAGLSCQVRGAQVVPMEELDEWVQDALDLIEYANGPVDSYWGAKRVAAGHPEPFNLKYLGIGNENWGPEYHERFAFFQEAIKEKYPEIKLITGAGVAYDGPDYRIAWDWAARIGADIFDEHMYCPPQWFFAHADRYDHYPRGVMEIFVGEYAAHGERRKNNLEAALAEAAFITGLERNSDLVTMSAYAPLFNKVGASQWTPDLIWFDNTRVYGTPSYYVQQMFSVNKGDVILPFDFRKSPSAQGEDTMYFACSRDYENSDIIIKAANRSTEKQLVKIDLKSDNFTFSGEGQAIILTSERLSDENSFENPTKVAPVTEKLKTADKSFLYRFSPYSVTVLRIRY